MMEHPAVVHPGYIYSENGDKPQYVNFQALCRQYQLSPYQTIDASDEARCEEYDLGFFKIHIFPEGYYINKDHEYAPSI